MKRLLLVLVALFFVGVGAAMAYNTSGVINVNCSTSLSIAVSTGIAEYTDTGTMSLGALNTASSCVLPPFYVWNTTPATSNTSLAFKLATGGTQSAPTGGVDFWTYATAWPGSVTATGLNTVAIGAAFASAITTPGFANFTSNDIVNSTSGSNKWTHGSYFDPTGAAMTAYGSSLLYNSPPGTFSAVALYIDLVTPSAVTGTASQQITINVTAVTSGS